MGIDYSKDDNVYKVTLRAVDAKPTAGGIEPVPEVTTVDGKSIFEAIRKSGTIYGKKTYWSHLQSIIVSKEVAEQDMLKVLDFFYRDAELRQDYKIYMSTASSAEEIVRIEAFLQKERRYNLRHAIKTKDFSGAFPETDFIDFYARALEETVEPIVPIINIYKSDGSPTIILEGTALFRDGKVVGKLSRYETLMLLLIRNEVKNPLIVVPIDNKENLMEGKRATIEIFDSRTKIKSSIEEGNIKIYISTTFDAAIAEMNYSMNYLNENNTKELKAIVEDNIKEQMLKTIKIVQNNYKTDVFGFGKYVERYNPKEWKSIKNEWNKKFSEVSVDVEVTANIVSTGKPATTVKEAQ